MNKKNFKRSAASLLLASTLALTGCKGNVSERKDESLDASENTITISGVALEESNLKEVVIGNKIVSVSDLKLADKNGNIINSITTGIAGNKLVPVENKPFIIYNSNIDYVLVENELVPVSDLVLVNSATKEVVKNIDYAIINGELVPFKDVIINSNNNSDVNTNSNEKIEFNYDNSAVITRGEDYEELTTEKFEELCAKKIKDFEELGIQVKREDVIKFIMVFNIDKLKQDNQELVREIIGNQTIEEVFADAETVSDALLSYEVQQMFYNGESFSVADCIFDKEQRELVSKFEDRKLEIMKADNSDREQMTEELLYDLCDAQNEFRKFEDDALYLVLRHGIVPIDSVYFKDSTFHSTLTGNARLYMFQFIAPYGATEEEIRNSVMSGARRNMMDSFKICVEDAKTLTK